MALTNKIENDIEKIIESYLEFIRANIQKFNPQKADIDVNDIAQEVKLKLWKVFRSKKKIRHHSSFIRKVVYSTTIDIMRKLKREKEILVNYHNSDEEKDVSCNSDYVIY